MTVPAAERVAPTAAAAEAGRLLRDGRRLLRDGRRLWRWRAAAILPAAGATRAAVAEARWRGCVLVADGHQLILVEPWLSALGEDVREALAGDPGGVIALLRGEAADR